MKFVGLGLVLVPLVCSASEPLIPMAEGTTWNYDLLQERPSASLDLTEPNEQEHIAVTYRIGGNEKVDGKDLRRLEIYRGDTLENIDLISIDEHGIICPARSDGKGSITKLDPPQQMLAAPVKTGTNWNFNGTIGDTKVQQHYETRGEEDVDVPAGKFHAWRIHCDQTLPTTATIDRWLVPGTGFVRIETAVKGASGTVLQTSRLELKTSPKIADAPRAKNAPLSGKIFSVGLSSEPLGEFKTTFGRETGAIYARWHAQRLAPQAKIRALFVAESVADVAADYEIDEASAVAPAPSSGGTFTLSQPDGGWAPGNYRVEFYVDDTLTETVKLKIVK